MFKKDKAPSANPNMTDTIIGEKSRIEGNLLTDTSLRIEGQVEGDIETKGDVTIGQNGKVLNCQIKARNVINAGVIRGAVHAREKLTITETGKLYGDIHVKSLNIANGGHFEGTSMMEQETEQHLSAVAAGGESNTAQGKPHLQKVEGKGDQTEDRSKKAAAR